MRAHKLGTTMNYRFIWVLGVVLSALAGAKDSYVSDEVLVKFRANASLTEAITIESLGAKVKERLSHIGWTVVKLPQSVSVPSAVNYFKTFGDVLNAEPNYIRQPFFTPNDPNWPQQYGPKKIKADLAWDITTGSSAIIVAVLDTGVDLSHPDLQGKLVAGYDFSDGDNDPSDYQGHGTHVAGIVAAATNNSKGVAGTGFNTRIMPIKVFPNATISVVVNAMKYAADNGAKVISMSYGGGGVSQAEEDGLNYAYNKGVLMVASAGNNGDTNKLYPAGYVNAIAVAASDQNDQRADFSTYGDWVDVAAPGVDILSTFMGGGYGNLSGTSMSCPMVSGMAALVWARAGVNTPVGQIRALIENNCDPVGNWVVKGRVNAFRAVSAAVPPQVYNFPPTSISLYAGTYVSGDLSSILASDNVRYQINTSDANLGPVAGATITSQITQPVGNLINLKLTIELNATGGATNMIWLYNWQTGEYDFWKAFPLSTGDKSVVVEISQFSKYISQTGEVSFITRSNRPKRLPGGAFAYQIDFVKLSGTFR